jgi:serine/threonine-protein kinase
VPAHAPDLPRTAGAARGPLSTPADLPPLLRQRLIVVAVLTVVAAAFFGVFRAVQPAELAYFLASWPGIAVLVAEAAVGLIAAAVAVALWRHPDWWTLPRLRAVEYVLVFDMAVYIASSQLVAFQGERLAAGAAADPYLVRLATDSMAVRWAVGIIGLSTLIPETLRRNTWLVAAQVGLAMLITTWMAVTDPIYAPRAGRVVAQMGVWMVLTATIAIFGAAKLAELRQRVAEARRLGQYQLVRKLGAGGMGEVHLAEHLLLKQPVAIKLIRADRAGDPEALARFEREVQATARLNHWNTVQIYDYGFADDGTFYYVMEYLPGLTLEQMVQRHGPMPAARVIHFLRQLCAALREAHAMHLVHRDVKPANVMVCERGGVHDVAKLLDFGLVRGGGPTAATLADSHQILGTPGYMAPEQAQGAPALDAAADIYALGATAYLLLTGEPAIAHGPAVQMLIAQATETVRPVDERRPGVPADLAAVVMRCLDRQPSHRFADTDALDRALAGCADAGRWRPEDAAAWWQAHPLDLAPNLDAAAPRMTDVVTVGPATAGRA